MGEDDNMSFDKDIVTLRQMTAELEEYLLSEVEFWPLSGSSDLPRLSLGTYALTRQRLTAAPGSAELAGLIKQGEATLTRWRSNAEQKATRELHTRLRLWQNFLDEEHGRYATEVAQRVMMGLLITRYPRLHASADGERLATLDTRLRNRFPAGPFVWDTELQPAFPASEFWYLCLKGPTA
jgi:hypothetical protein